MRLHHDGSAVPGRIFLTLVMCVALTSCARTVVRSGVYETYDQRSMALYERQIADMEPAAIKAEAEALRQDMVANEQEVRDSLIGLKAASKARDRAAPGTEVEYGARYIEAQQRHKRARHSESRMRQMARILKEQYAEKFR